MTTEYHHDLLVRLRNSLREGDEKLAIGGRIATTDVSQLVDILSCIIDESPKRRATMDTATRRAAQINAGAPHTVVIIDLAWDLPQETTGKP
jgi:hypothetical protein